jgi:hypothetical protein
MRKTVSFPDLIIEQKKIFDRYTLVLFSWTTKKQEGLAYTVAVLFGGKEKTL